MIMFFKLWGGEEIVAETDEDGEWCEEISLRNPFRNVLTQQGMMLVPYPCNTIKVNVSHVIFRGSPNEDLVNAYRQVTGGVVVPSRELQIPN